MITVYFTCGQTHVHQIGGGKIWNKDSLIGVHAKSYDHAVDWAIEKFEAKFASDYQESELPELLKFCPNGVVAFFTA